MKHRKLFSRTNTIIFRRFLSICVAWIRFLLQLGAEVWRDLVLNLEARRVRHCRTAEVQLHLAHRRHRESGLAIYGVGKMLVSVCALVNLFVCVCKCSMCDISVVCAHVFHTFYLCVPRRSPRNAKRTTYSAFFKSTAGSASTNARNRLIALPAAGNGNHTCTRTHTHTCTRLVLHLYLA